MTRSSPNMAAFLTDVAAKGISKDCCLRDNPYAHSLRLGKVSEPIVIGMNNKTLLELVAGEISGHTLIGNASSITTLSVVSISGSFVLPHKTIRARTLTTIYAIRVCRLAGIDLRYSKYLRCLRVSNNSMGFVRIASKACLEILEVSCCEVRLRKIGRHAIRITECIMNPCHPLFTRKWKGLITVIELELHGRKRTSIQHGDHAFFSSMGKEYHSWHRLKMPSNVSRIILPRHTDVEIVHSIIPCSNVNKPWTIYEVLYLE